MAGKISGANHRGGGGGSVHNAYKPGSQGVIPGGIPTTKYSKQHEQAPETAGATFAGKMQHEQLQKDREGKGIAKYL
jgi:hypothetical protein